MVATLADTAPYRREGPERNRLVSFVEVSDRLRHDMITLGQQTEYLKGVKFVPEVMRGRSAAAL